VVREGWRQGGEMTQALYAHMNNKTIKEYQIIDPWGNTEFGYPLVTVLNVNPSVYASILSEFLLEDILFAMLLLTQ
jgi:hypothetical protein